MTRVLSKEPPLTPNVDERFSYVALDLIDRSTTNPRRTHNTEYLQRLTASVKEKGVLEPILLRPTKNGRYEIVVGECRFQAATWAERTAIPAIVRDYTDTQVLEIQLEENIHRHNLTPLDEARGYRALITMDPDKHSAVSIATRIGMSPGYVWDYLKLLDLIAPAQTLLEDERITVRHAILIARLKPADQKRVIDPAQSGRQPWQGVGLWQTETGALLDEGRPRGKYDGLKPVSIRELDTWIKEHIRLDVEHAAKAVPLEYEEVAAAVADAEAQPGRGKKVVPITFSYHVGADARDKDERTYGRDAWQRADGQEKSKTCEYSALGVVVAGSEHYGQTFAVCVNRDKCRVHFGASVKAKERAAKLRAAGKSGQAKRVETNREERWQVEQRKRHEAHERWQRLKPLAVDAVLAKLRPGKITDGILRDVVHQLAQGQVTDKELEKRLGGRKVSIKTFVWAVAILNVLSKDNTRDYFAPVAKKYGVDLAALEKQLAKDKDKPDAAVVHAIHTNAPQGARGK